MTSLAVVATSTTRATLGTCVLQLPMRSPAAVARQAGTLQMLSGGRFVLGVGVGTHRGEYEAAKVDFSRRGRLLDEAIEDLRAAWASAGDEDTRYRQDPPINRVPIWIAGMSEPAMARAARVGDGWVPMFVSPAEYRTACHRLTDLLGAAGRHPDDMTTSVVTFVRVGDSAEVARKDGTLWLSDLYALPPKAFERHLIAGPAEDCAAGIAAYHQAGASHVVVMVAAEEPLDHIGPVLEAIESASSPLLSGHPSGADPTLHEHLGAAP